MQDSSANASMVGNFFRNKWVWLVLAVDAVLLLVVVVLSVISVNKQSTIYFNVVPSEAQILVNGKGGYSNGSYYFAPGVYDIEVSYPGLGVKNFDVDISKDGTASVVTFLGGDGNFEFYEMRENLGDFFALADIASSGYNKTTDQDDSAGEFIAKFQKNYVLMADVLPIIDETPSKYGLDYGVHYQYDTLKIQEGNDVDGCIKTLCLYVTDTSGEKEEFARSVIRNFGFDIDEFQIVYRKVNYE